MQPGAASVSCWVADGFFFFVVYTGLLFDFSASVWAAADVTSCTTAHEYKIQNYNHHHQRRTAGEGRHVAPRDHGKQHSSTHPQVVTDLTAWCGNNPGDDAINDLKVSWVVGQRDIKQPCVPGWICPVGNISKEDSTSWRKIIKQCTSNNKFPLLNSITNIFIKSKMLFRGQLCSISELICFVVDWAVASCWPI